MRSLVTPNSRFDQWLGGDETALSAEERRGYALFKSYGCVSCHQGANVGGNMFQVFGVLNEYFKRRGNITEADLGRYNVTGNIADRHSFKVPSLRMAALTAPYLHDGSAATLRDAVDAMFEFQLGREAPDEDKDAIVAFIRTLAGESEELSTMRARALTVGILVSVLLLACGGGALRDVSRGVRRAQYREATGLVREIQQLSSQWSVEVARVRSDPLADFDALSGFIPRMERLKAGLRERVREIAWAARAGGERRQRVPERAGCEGGARGALQDRVRGGAQLHALPAAGGGERDPPRRRRRARRRWRTAWRCWCRT